MKSIILDIFKGVALSENEIQILGDALTEITLKKNDFLIKPEQEVNELYYIHSGCLRSYLIDTKGKEHILQFAIKGWWISDYIALYGPKQTRSVAYIECIKDACLYKLSKNDFDKLFQEIPRVAQFHIGKMESAFASFQMRILENLTLSAKERYVNFTKSYPDIEQNVKNYHIASYLGITTESLSRIRKEIALQ